MIFHTLWDKRIEQFEVLKKYIKKFVSRDENNRMNEATRKYREHYMGAIRCSANAIYRFYFTLVQQIRFEAANSIVANKS